jgi:ferredoxin
VYTILAILARLVYNKGTKNPYKEYNMAYKITDACVNCGTCDPECPNEAISEKDGARVIDADKCVDCGACQSVCPAEAIVAA